MTDFITLREASKQLNHPVRTIRHWVITGKLKAIKNRTNYRWMLPSSEIKRFMEDNADAYERRQYPN